MNQDLQSEIRDYLLEIVKEGVRQALNEHKESKDAENPYYTVKEACTKLSISTTTLYRLTKLNPNLFEVSTIGHKKLYSKTSVDKVLAKRNTLKTTQ